MRQSPVRISVLLIAVLLAVSCETSASITTTTTAPAGTTTQPTTTTTATTVETTTSSAVSTTPATTETTAAPEQVFVYGVVAEEDARRLAVAHLDPTCVALETVCELSPVATIPLDYRPHNLTSSGPVVYATHPAAGSISRVSFPDGQVTTVAVGEEPHDIKYDPRADVLYVADEAGRALLKLDPETLEVLNRVDLPGDAHDLIVADAEVWVTLIGHDALARVRGDRVDLLTTGGSPHDLIVDENGMIWFSNWNSEILNVFDPSTGTTVEAPAGVAEPHHFALDADGSVWVSDNGGSSVVGFTSDPPVTIEVGPSPHHLLFVDGALLVAVSGTGEAVFIEDGRIVARAELSRGLHGVARVVLQAPLDGSDNS